MLDIDEIRNLIAGKLKHRKCPACDNNGTVYWDGKTGEGEKSNPSGIDPQWLAFGGCENCKGLGYILYY